MLDIEINFVNLENLCDDWGFKENEIIDAHNMLRSTQANLAVLEGKIMYALPITYLQKEEAYAIVSHIGVQDPADHVPPIPMPELLHSLQGIFTCCLFITQKYEEQRDEFELSSFPCYNSIILCPAAICRTLTPSKPSTFS
ncbi:unnamed protein product [Brassica rapa subsp. trilocularis]